MPELCSAIADNTFGPVIQGCNYADFTLLFEQSIFSIGPSALIICIAPLRAWNLRHKPNRILRHRGLLSKLIILTLLAAIQLASLINWAIEAHVRTEVSIASAVLSFVSALTLLALSYAEHTRCVQPSSVISLYLGLTLLLDIPQARTLFSREVPTSIAALFISCMIVKALAFTLEAQSKRKFLRTPYDRYSPEALGSIISRSFQWWVNPLFIHGFRKLLSVSDLYSLNTDLSSARLARKFRQLWPQTRTQPKKHPLRTTLALQLKLQIAFTMLPRILLIGFKFCQPLLISRVTSVLSSRDQVVGYDSFLIPAAALIYSGLAVFNSLYTVQVNRLKTMTRGILVGCIFEKTLQGSDKGDKASLTLMTNDTERITTYMEHVIDSMLGSFIEIVVAMILLARLVGWVCVVPIILSAAASAWGFLNSGAAAPLQKAWVSASQDRVSFTAKVLAFPKAMKMMDWASELRDQIHELRVRETELSKPMTRFGVMRNVIGHAPGIYAPPATLTVAVLVQGHGFLDVEQAFTTLAIVALLTSPVERLVQSIPMLGSMTALLDRIESFLLEKSKDHTEVQSSIPRLEIDMELQDLTQTPKDDAFVFQNAAFEYNSRQVVLRDVNATICRGTLTLIYGPVGSGKSTLLRSMIGELHPAVGSMSRLSKTSSYCDQEPWLPNTTIQDIVTLGTDLDVLWYKKILEACALSKDIHRLPLGDETVVGSKGVQLSGGQRQRLALARALYARNDVIVADNVLSGLDAATMSAVFNRVFGSYGICSQLNMTAVLATHNKIFATAADQIILLGPEGRMLSCGPPISVSRQLEAVEMGHNDFEVELNEEEDLASNTPSSREPVPSDAEQDRLRKAGDFGLYFYYTRNIGLLRGLLFVIPACIFTFCLGFPSLWLKLWAEAADQTSNRNGLYIGLYFFFAVGSSLFGGLAMLQFTSVIVPALSRNLHRRLLDAVFNARYRYFASVDSGTIVNRFSQDMLMVDANLAGSAFMAAMFILQAIMEAALIVSASIYLLAVLPAVLTALFLLQYVYLRTSRQLRFLELEAQAPLQTHFMESIDGLATIRAFGLTERAAEKSQGLLDTSQQPFYLLLCVQVWLALVLELIVAGLAVLILAIALNVSHGTSAGAVGVSLIGILTFSGTLTNLIKAWTSLETSLGAVARVRNFEESVESEDKVVTEPTQIPQNWPSGQISFNRVSATYGDIDDPALVDLDLHIKPGEKVGICGRSGSGKSSVLLTLFRMLNVSSGSVTLDGVDTRHVFAQTLREHISVVSQEPVILPGTLRFNVDPSCAKNDQEIVSVLEKVGLRMHLQQREGGLDSPLDQTSLSAGQQQLINVARAMLQKRSILVLDEATSSVDPETEEKITRLIHEHFDDCTVIAIAHRLNSLKAFDRLVTLDNGRIIKVEKIQPSASSSG
ncbi:hypothetical protein AAFC00_000641 [Neodothiora populina]|uniref:ABC transporter n=1 Tax=Neodothiora populina TaxID=2781224 RepID=A0ABR3PEP5_9PEZI